MKVYLNEKEIEVDSGISLLDLKKIYNPDADIYIYNGYHVTENVKLSENDSIVFIKKGKIPDKDKLEAMIVARHTPQVHEKIKNSTVGIAGLGGLGSNVAVSLARMGIGKLVLVDYDVVEPSNLNRQEYFIDQLGKYKSEAIKEVLKKINPYVKYETHNEKVKKNNIKDLFSECDIIVEAFDKAETKAMFIDYILNKMDQYIVAASGMAGYESSNTIKTRKIGKLYICGDEKTEARPGQGLMAPRVSICANHQANQVIRLLLGIEEA